MTTCTGIQPWEEKYVEMAEAMGIDPKVLAHTLQDEHYCITHISLYADPQIRTFCTIRQEGKSVVTKAFTPGNI